MNEPGKDEVRNYNRLVTAVSIAIPLVVAALFGINLRRMGLDVEPLSFLPPIYATINGITAIILLAGLWAIKTKRTRLHEWLMKSAILCSALFLIMYVAYHMTSDSTKFGGEGISRYIYYLVLITHIVLSIAIIPLVLITYVRAITRQYAAHRKIARIAFPIWLYVAVSGVVVYLMISPYYK